MRRRSQHDSEQALTVNWRELVTTDAAGKVLYRNAFATSPVLNDGNVAEMVEAEVPLENRKRKQQYLENQRLPL